MCGRFAITLPSDAMAQLFSARPANDLPQVPNVNVCPTTQIHTVTSDGADRHLGAMRWGFVPHWFKTLTDGPLLINARAETIATKPAFAEACRARRCLIPASAFYEWTALDGRKQPWRIAARDAAPLALAGIWQAWEGHDGPLRTCAIVTTKANDALSQLHHRMPVIVPPDDWPLWLGETGKGAARLMRPAPEDALSFEVVEPF
ncbi:SOS response-associated peptidase [Rhodobacteraceae bacterium KMM 6894]|nr:SOS response-associated peptidase [Rhodobacteraceae bacterium KMM 6894]